MNDTIGFVQDRWSLHVRFAPEAEQRADDPNMTIPDMAGFLIRLGHKLARSEYLAEYAERVLRLTGPNAVEVSVDDYDIVYELLTWVLASTMVCDARIVKNGKSS